MKFGPLVLLALALSFSACKSTEVTSPVPENESVIDDQEALRRRRTKPRPSPSPSPTPTATPAPSPSATPASQRIYGVTTDGVWDLPPLLESLRRLPKRVTTRVVFDEGVAAAEYKYPVQQISLISDVMGEILDSSSVRALSVSQYAARTTEYLQTLGNTVRIWEIGNEINGEWLGDIPSVVAKMTNAYDQVKAQGKIAALTLYYNEDCWMYPTEEMFAWAQKNVPDRMKQGLDYVWVSYYEDDCNGLQPNWQTVFTRLGQMFPNSKIGFGEVGTRYAAKKEEYLRRYYTLQINAPNYVGGYFWWYFRQDMVPYTNPLWNVLSSVIQ